MRFINSYSLLSFDCITDKNIDQALLNHLKIIQNFKDQILGIFNLN